MPNKEPRRILLQSIFGTDEQKKKRVMSTMSTKRKRWPIEKNRLRQVMRVDGTPWYEGPEYIRKCLDGVRLESFSFYRHQKKGYCITCRTNVQVYSIHILTRVLSKYTDELYIRGDVHFTPRLRFTECETEAALLGV